MDENRNKGMNQGPNGNQRQDPQKQGQFGDKGKPGEKSQVGTATVIRARAAGRRGEGQKGNDRERQTAR